MAARTSPSAARAGRGGFQKVAVDTAGMDPAMKHTLFGPQGFHATPSFPNPFTRPINKIGDFFKGVVKTFSSNPNSSSATTKPVENVPHFTASEADSILKGYSTPTLRRER